MARRLHVDGEHFARVASSDKNVGADDLGRIAGTDAGQFGRRDVEPGKQRGDRQHDQAEQPFDDLHDDPHLSVPAFALPVACGLIYVIDLPPLLPQNRNSCRAPSTCYQP
jgi:hypothetical protein